VLKEGNVLTQVGVFVSSFWRSRGMGVFGGGSACGFETKLGRGNGLISFGGITGFGGSGRGMAAPRTSSSPLGGVLLRLDATSQIQAPRPAISASALNNRIKRPGSRFIKNGEKRVTFFFFFSLAFSLWVFLAPFPADHDPDLPHSCVLSP